VGWWLALALLVALTLLARRDPAVRELIAAMLELRPRELWALGVALARDRRVPGLARLIPLGLVRYLALPLDAIPDVIPLIGQLDDLLIAVFAAWLVVRLVPREVIEEHRRALLARRRDVGAPC